MVVQHVTLPENQATMRYLC